MRKIRLSEVKKHPAKYVTELGPEPKYLDSRSESKEMALCMAKPYYLLGTFPSLSCIFVVIDAALDTTE